MKKKSREKKRSAHRPSLRAKGNDPEVRYEKGNEEPGRTPSGEGM